MSACLDVFACLDVCMFGCSRMFGWMSTCLDVLDCLDVCMFEFNSCFSAIFQIPFKKVADNEFEYLHHVSKNNFFSRAFVYRSAVC